MRQFTGQTRAAVVEAVDQAAVWELAMPMDAPVSGAPLATPDANQILILLAEDEIPLGG